MAYFDNASTTYPKPYCVENEIQPNVFQNINPDIGYDEWRQTMTKCTKRLLRNSKAVSLNVKTVLKVLMKSNSAVMMVHQK